MTAPQDELPLRPRDRSRNRARRRARGRVTVVGVCGELFITAGILVLLFLGWQLWWNDAILAKGQSSAAADQNAQWAIKTSPEPSTAPSTASPAPNAPATPAEPVVDTKTYDNAEVFAIMYVPRFGAGTQRNIAQGYGMDVLNSFKMGVGHYPSTQMPGAVGNFAVAAHRSAYGGGMHLIDQFQVGDPIYIETKDGWFTYRFRNLEYVTPTATDVLDAIPRVSTKATTDRLITLTTCNPLYSTAERIAAYGTYESFRPGAGNPPPEIAADVAKWGK